MKITKKWLTSHKACCSEEDKQRAEAIGDPKEIVKQLIAKNRFSDARWLVMKLLTKKQNVAMAVYAAHNALHIFEEKYPDDKRPRQAVNSAVNVLENAAAAAVSAAYAAAATNAADAYAAASASAYAAYAAAADGDDAAAAYAAAASSYAAGAVASYAASSAVLSEILYFGLSLEETT